VLSRLRNELVPTLRLAVPLASAELAWMAMGVVDTIMVGPLGPAAIGAGSLASIVFYTVVLCVTGVLLGMDTLVSQSWGAGDLPECRRSLIDGLWLSVLLTPISMAALLLCMPVLHAVGTNPRVYSQTGEYLTAVVWSVLPLFLYSAFRRYLQAVHVVKAITFGVVTANLLNFLGNWILIYGHWGAPPMGIRGSAWSTCIARVYMLLVLVIAAVRQGALRDVEWRPDWRRIRRLFGLGAPAAAQIGAEAGVFAAVTALAAKLDDAAIAAHGIALNVISVTYMVPLGISSAAAVRVGNAIGRKDAPGAIAAGWTALLAAAAFMGTAALVLFTIPEAILRLYSADGAVIRAGVVLLGTAALFQLFDGTQVVATGALRGAGDTRTPFLVNLAAYWGVGMPVAWLLCFQRGWGAPGLWVGLCVALILTATTLLAAWVRRMRILAFPR
jgi:MATE family multidrug resistance protein